MPTSVMSVFSNLSDFADGLRVLGNVHLIATRPGEFGACLTEIGLQHVRLWSVDEHVPRIGFQEVPSDVLLILFVTGDQPGPICGGVRLAKGELLSCGPRQCLHVRTEGRCCWGAVSFPAGEFRAYFNKLTGRVLATSVFAQRWRPSTRAGKRFLRLHAAAIRAARLKPFRIVDPEAAHGMEQQVIHSLVGCLSVPADDVSDLHQCQEVVSNFENILQRKAGRHVDLRALCAELAISGKHLRRCCNQILGVGPAAYVRLYLSEKVPGASREGTAPTVAMYS